MLPSIERISRVLQILLILSLPSCNNKPEQTTKEPETRHTESACVKLEEPNPDNHVIFNFGSRVDWANYEINMDAETKKALIAKLDNKLFYVKESDYYGDMYNSTFHFLHLNSDTLIDVIYEGWSGGESDVSKFFYNKGGGFMLQFEEYQYVSDLVIKDQELASLTVVNFGCCAEYVEWEKIFKVDNDSFKLDYKRAKINQTTEPRTYFKKAKKFIVENPRYYLRYEPKINDDELYAPWMEGIGNRVAEYTIGDHGIAFAEKTDRTGRTWWFVEMQEKKVFQYNIIYEPETGNSKYLGWMSSRFLKEVN